MKKTILMIMVCLMTTATNSLAESTYTGKVFLQHKGNITQTFNGDEISNAIEAAVDGDTLFLSKGLFKSGFTINKSISLIGSGAEAGNDEQKSTYLEWSGSTPQIKTDDSKTLSAVIEGVFSGLGFSVSGNIDNITFKKCYFPNSLDLNSTIKTAVIDRCILTNYLYISGNIEDLTVKNCKINYLNDYGNHTNTACKFINCNIYKIAQTKKAMFINSIINYVGNEISDLLDSNSMLVNTLYHKMNGYDPMEQASQQDCWSTTETLLSDTNQNADCTMTADQLKTAGYLGIDDTVVGVEGGVNPYSLTIHAPSINSKSANIDLTNKKVTINVNVTAN